MQSLGMSQESDSEAQCRASLYEALESVGLLDVYLDYIAQHPEAAR